VTISRRGVSPPGEANANANFLLFLGCWQRACRVVAVVRKREPAEWAAQRTQPLPDYEARSLMRFVIK
jgi:hypothetical protein